VTRFSTRLFHELMSVFLAFSAARWLPSWVAYHFDWVMAAPILLESQLDPSFLPGMIFPVRLSMRALTNPWDLYAMIVSSGLDSSSPTPSVLPRSS